MEPATPYSALMWAAIIVLTYAVVVRGLMTIAHPLRERLVDVANELLASPELDVETRNAVRKVLERNFRTRDAWYYAVLPLPALVMYYSGHKDRAGAIADAQLKTKVTVFRMLSIVTALCNSPLALIIFFFQMFFYSAIIRSASVLFAIISDLYSKPDHVFGGSSDGHGIAHP